MSNEAEMIIKAFKIELDKQDGDVRDDTIPDLTNVTPESLGMTNEIFYTALRELEEKGYISNVCWTENQEALCDHICIKTKEFALYDAED